MKAERPQEQFNQLYIDISRSLAAASDQLATLRVDHEDGRQTLGGIRQRLQQIREDFDNELILLQENAEWDKLTIAFFGETNAGKSTVLEALRILFGEEGRAALLNANDHDVVRYEQALQAQIKLVRDALHTAVLTHAERLMEIHVATKALGSIVRSESSVRVRVRHWVFAVIGAALGTLSTFVALKALTVL